MKPAARSGDMHLCPAQTPPLPVPHIGGPVLPAPATVLIGGSPAATLGQMCLCTGIPDSIITGSMTVLINNKPAARLGDSTAHGGIIVSGMPSVLISG
ncbi:PAAR domain-containing protein [Morganella morganii]|uniref:PAAR domain-containing protein n=1 Tax=Morganella morganii TaxID=582 RepID=UPI001C496D56|nr:PAAR domain-containing protein [Morganella morganii]QXO66725.1 PAAR domain-containing protein [Morganella morganii]